MEDIPHMGIRELRQHFGRLVDEAYYLKRPTVITKNGVEVAFIGPKEWLDERAELERYRAKFGPIDSP